MTTHHWPGRYVIGDPYLVLASNAPALHEYQEQRDRVCAPYAPAWRCYRQAMAEVDGRAADRDATQLTSVASADREPNRWMVLALLGAAQLMVVLDATIVNIALPRRSRTCGFSTESRQWIVTAYALAFGSLLLLGGKLGDLFGRKWTFIGGLVGFSVASAIGGFAESFGVLVAARTLQGAFGALLAPSALVAADGDVRRVAGPAQGVRDLRCDRRRRRLGRPDPRRVSHRRCSRGAGAST